MHDIWNPWHGCLKYTEGCDNCYMYFLDRIREQDGSNIYKTKNGFTYPLQKRRDGSYKVRSGEMLRVCMSSDFFLEEADEWREEAWKMMYFRPDVKFFLLTKRAERMAAHLPDNWGDGWENVMLNVTCENQRRADERIPYLLETPAKHKGIMCAPMLGPISIASHLASGQIEQVLCGGENYDGARPCHFEWAQKLGNECRVADVTFCFFETGTVFVRDGQRFWTPDKQLQSERALAAGLNYLGKPVEWKLTDRFGMPVPDDELYVPHYLPHCEKCASRMFCNGCSDCGKCKN